MQRGRVLSRCLACGASCWAAGLLELLYVVPGAGLDDLCAGPAVGPGAPRAVPGAAPSRASGPQHLMLLAPRLSFPPQTRFLLPEPKMPDARSLPFRVFRSRSISLLRKD